MEDVRGAGRGEVWPLPIGWQHSYFYLCGSTTSSTHLLIATFHKNNSLNANQIMEDMWHIDALGDRVVGQPSTPFDLRIILYYGDFWIRRLALKSDTTETDFLSMIFCSKFCESIIEIQTTCWGGAGKAGCGLDGSL